MKRIGDLFEKIVDIENIKLAEKKAIKGKRNTYGVQRHLKNREDNLYNIQQILLRGEYTTSECILEELKFEIKSNYQVFPVDVRGIDWVGYVHHRNYTKIRKSIKKRYIKNNNKITHYSWLKHCNSKNLRNKYEVNL